MQQICLLGGPPIPIAQKRAPVRFPTIYPGASATLRPVLASIAALSRADQAQLMRAIRAAQDAAKPKRIGSSNTFRGYDDFQPAFMAARVRAIEFFGPQWYLNPDLALYAQIPASWANCKLFNGATKHGPRDVHFPRAQFWPDGTLPVGPVYADYGPIDPSADVRLIRERQTAQRDATRHIWQDAPDFALEHTPEDIDREMETV